MSTATLAIPAKKTEDGYTNPFALKGKGKPEKLKVKDLHRYRELQARMDVDGTNQEEGRDGTVDEGRAEQFAQAMLPKDKGGEGATFPPIKVMKVQDARGRKGEDTFVIFDGMHTHRAAEIARVPELDCLVWEGTAAQALAAAATVANREHEKNGKPLSSKDKVHAVAMMASAFTKGEIPKKDWPSNRQLAEVCGCSRQLVNNMDPFGRSGSAAPDRREQTNAQKRAARANPVAAGAAHVNGQAGGTPHLDPVTRHPANFEVVRKATKETVARYAADTPEKALERYHIEHAGAQMRDYVAVEVKGVPNPQPKVGSEKPVGFDWAGMDAHIGYAIRSFDAMGDLFGLKKTPEYKAAFDKIDGFAAYVKGQREEQSRKKADAGKKADEPAKAGSK